MPNGVKRLSVLLLVTIAAGTLLALGAAGSAVAQEHVVSENVPVNNQDGDCGGKTVDHDDIQDAVDAAGPGDTILVCPGEYTETVTVDQEVRIVSHNPESTASADQAILRNTASNETAILVDASNVSIEGLVIDNYTQAGIAVATTGSVSNLNVNRTVVEGTSSGFGVLLSVDGGTLSDVTLDELALSANEQGLGIVALNGGDISSVDSSNLLVNDSTEKGITTLANGTSTVSGVNVTDSIVNDTAGIGIGIEFVATESGTVEAVNVSTVDVSGNVNGIGLVGAGNTVQDVEVNEVLLRNQASAGLGVVTQNGGNVTQVSVSRVVANGSDVGVLLNGSGGTVSDFRIDESDIGSTEGNNLAGIEFNNGTASNYNNVTVTKSLIRNNGHGVLVNSNVTTDLSRPAVNVSYNLIRNNGVGVQNNNSNTVFDARLNYWGDSSGPSSATSSPLADPVFGVLANGNGDSVSEGQSGDSNVQFAPSIGGKRTCEDGQLFDPIPNESIETSLEGETIGGPITDFVGFCIWDRAVLPFRTTSDTAVQSITNIPTFIDTANGQTPINRQNLNVYQKNQVVNLTFDGVTGADTTRYAGQDAQVLIAKVTGEGVDENASVEDLFSADFDAVSGSGTVGTQSVEFVAVKNETLNSTGELPQDVQFTPSSSGTYVAVMTANEVGDGYALNNNGNLTGNVHKNDITAVGFEAIAVRETESTATPGNGSLSPNDTDVYTGSSVEFQLDAGFNANSFTHLVVLYNEDNFTDSTLVIDAEGSFNSSNLTFDNGVLRGTLTADDGTTENVTIEVDGPVEGLLNNISVAGGFTVIDSSATGVTNADRTETVTVSTDGFESNGTYRYVHTATAQDGRFSTTDGTINVVCQSIVQGVDQNNNGVIDTSEMLTAIDEYWRPVEAVPDTCGKTMTTSEMLNIIDSFWRPVAEVAY